MFVPRIWCDEVERIGKQKCTPIGYTLQSIGELIGFVGLLMFPAATIYLIYRGVAGSFHWSLLCLLLLPLSVGILDTIIVSLSWQLAGRKQFNYDYDRRESTWVENGEQKSFTYADWQAANHRAE